jgi:hypothetical protein
MKMAGYAAAEIGFYAPLPRRGIFYDPAFVGAKQSQMLYSNEITSARRFS